MPANWKKSNFTETEPKWADGAGVNLNSKAKWTAAECCKLFSDTKIVNGSLTPNHCQICSVGGRHFTNDCSAFVEPASCRHINFSPWKLQHVYFNFFHAILFSCNFFGARNIFEQKQFPFCKEKNSFECRFSRFRLSLALFRLRVIEFPTKIGLGVSASLLLGATPRSLKECNFQGAEASSVLCLMTADRR